MTDDESPRKGDVLLLQAGDLVPADIKLLEAQGLEVDEWELTGELMPVEKQVGEETGYLYHGSRITRGSGKGVVVAAGSETEYGEIRKHIREEKRHRHQGLFRHLCTSREIRKLKARGIVVHDETSLLVLSRVDVLCLDKTGVLTTLDMEVDSLHFAEARLEAATPLSDDARGTLTGIGCALCNDIYFLERRDQANPLDAALLSYARDQGYDINQLSRQYEKVYDKPFESSDRYMAVGFEQDGRRLYFAKGDPEVVLRMCSTYMTSSGAPARVDARYQRSVRAVLDSATEKGAIVLALACSQEAEMPPRHYVFLCLVLLRNPLRPSVPRWIRDLGAMGIRPIMVTGDRSETAMTIGKEAGICRDATHPITGKELSRMPLQEVARQAGYVSIFARMLPSQKGLLVHLLQRRGHCVAMVGDGANDTVALRVADVGVSFVEVSSPLARRVARVLVHDLADVQAIFEDARRLEWRIKAIGVLCVVALIAIVIASTVAAFT